MKKLKTKVVENVKLFFGIDYISLTVNELQRNLGSVLVNYHGLYCVLPLDKNEVCFKANDGIADLGFWFRKYEVAVSFMNTYRSYHTIEFWNSLKRKVYTFSFVCSLMSKLERKVLMECLMSDMVYPKN